MGRIYAFVWEWWVFLFWYSVIHIRLTKDRKWNDLNVYKLKLHRSHLALKQSSRLFDFLSASQNILNDIDPLSLHITKAWSYQHNTTKQCSPWWRHQMEPFSALLAICMGNSQGTDEFSTQRPVTLSFDVFFDLHLNKRLSKQHWGWWFETPSRTSWRHCNHYTEKYSALQIVEMYKHN